MAKKSNEIELSPLRSLDDFLLGSARFQLPNYRDLEKWGNRVVQNLLYYQTNYFLMSLVIILSVTVLHPLEMASGGLTILILYGLFCYVVNTTSSVMRFKKKYPLIAIGIMIGGSLTVFYMLGSIIVFMFGIMLPISITFVHASLRLRNLMNKLSNIERVVSNRTPMGVFLESLAIGIFESMQVACRFQKLVKIVFATPEKCEKVEKLAKLTEKTKGWYSLDNFDSSAVEWTKPADIYEMARNWLTSSSPTSGFSFAPETVTCASQFPFANP